MRASKSTCVWIIGLGIVLTLVLHRGTLLAEQADQPTSSPASLPLPAVDVQRAKQPKRPAKRKQQATRRAPPIAAPAPTPPPVIETATSPVAGYLAGRSATGIKTDTPLREIPQSVTVVTADRVRDQGSVTLQETLRYVPGVYADAYGPDSRGDYPRVRGSDPDIYLDGMRVIDVWRFGEGNGGSFRRLHPVM